MNRSPHNPDQARLRPHLRTEPAPSYPSTIIDKRLPKQRRTTNPAQLQGVGIIGNPNALARGIAGAGQLADIQRAEREAIKRAGDRIDTIVVLKRYANRCYLCRTKLTVNTAQQEHIIPISRAGTHTTANVAVACPPCNRRKRNYYVAFMVASRKPIYIDDVR